MAFPKVSIIIPNYNHAEYLRQRIESVLNQTYRNFEIIILDDNSSDRSQEVILEYRSNPLIKGLLFNQENSGSPFKQWKKGLEQATGEWIWIAESDDYADERFLEVMITALDAKSKIGLVYCDSKIVHQSHISHDTFATVKNKRFNTNRWASAYHNSGLDEIENYLLPGGTINNTSAVLFNKEILCEVNPFDLNLRYIGDKYAFIKVLSNSDVVYVHDSLNYFRDPFNTKHADRSIYYFYEQFLVFAWAYRNIELVNKGKFFKAFYANTQNSLYRGWNKLKFSLYLKLFRVDNYLLIKSIMNNFALSITSLLKKN